MTADGCFVVSIRRYLCRRVVVIHGRGARVILRVMFVVLADSTTGLLVRNARGSEVWKSG
jgi:hypothetical protein